MPKLLIVEDNVFFRETLARILINSFPSVEIAEAGSGQQAFREIEAEKPKLIFMDIGLPGENGIQLTKEISDRFPEIAIIVISNYDTRKYRDAALEAGAAVFMSKESSTPKDIIETAKKTLPELSA
jgi:DNA-binding NarL/FixJ family response regulator